MYMYMIPGLDVYHIAQKTAVKQLISSWHDQLEYGSVIWDPFFKKTLKNWKGPIANEEPSVISKDITTQKEGISTRW